MYSDVLIQPFHPNYRCSVASMSEVLGNATGINWRKVAWSDDGSLGPRRNSREIQTTLVAPSWDACTRRGGSMHDFLFQDLTLSPSAWTPSRGNYQLLLINISLCHLCFVSVMIAGNCSLVMFAVSLPSRLLGHICPVIVNAVHFLFFIRT